MKERKRERERSEFDFESDTHDCSGGSNETADVVKRRFTIVHARHLLTGPVIMAVPLL